MHSFDIVGYSFNADIYCPSCIIGALPTGPGEAFDGWALADGADPMSTEGNLAEIASAFGIDVEDESSYDSGDFPKVIFADSVEDSSERCGACGESLIEGDDVGDDDADPNVMLTLAHFCADYHSGQWSRLYRLGCRVGRRLRADGISHPLDSPLNARERELYAHLASEYGTERR